MEDNIKTDLPERGYGGVDWINLARDLRVSTKIKLFKDLAFPQYQI